MSKRIALVTGASKGIGRAIALELARAGFTVGVNYPYHSQDRAEETVANITASGGEAIALQADVADPQAVEGMFTSLDRHFGRLDVLVNNAGIGARIDSLTAIDDATWRRTLAMNLDGAFYCMRAATARMRGGGGRIANMSSGAAKTGGVIGAHYAASKAGLLALTAKAARDLAREGITVNAVLPSIIETEMLDALAGSPEARERLRGQFPIGRFGRPEEVAQVVRFLIAEAPSYLTGEFLSLRGGRL